LIEPHSLFLPESLRRIAMKRMAVAGFVIWAVATAALRLGGQYVFRGGSPILLLVITIPAMMAVAIALLQRYQLPEQRALAAVALVAPGMLLDTISAIWFSTVFSRRCFGVRVAELPLFKKKAQRGAVPSFER
jgi:hypothetical protein